jgi:cytochrome c6
MRNILFSFLFFFHSSFPIEKFLIYTFQSEKVKYSIQEKKEEQLGKEIFQKNCMVCHIGGGNIIIPEKDLKKESLEANGMNNLSAITYQILNGKNGMPAFGGRLTDQEMEQVALFVLKNDFSNSRNP